MCTNAKVFLALKQEDWWGSDGRWATSKSRRTWDPWYKWSPVQRSATSIDHLRRSTITLVAQTQGGTLFTGGDIIHSDNVTKHHPDMNVRGRNRKHCLTHAPSIPTGPREASSAVCPSFVDEADQCQFLRYPEAQDSLRPLIGLHYNDGWHSDESPVHPTWQDSCWSIDPWVMNVRDDRVCTRGEL